MKKIIFLLVIFLPLHINAQESQNNKINISVKEKSWKLWVNLSSLNLLSTDEDDYNRAILFNVFSMQYIKNTTGFELGNYQFHLPYEYSYIDKVRLEDTYLNFIHYFVNKWFHFASSLFRYF